MENVIETHDLTKVYSHKTVLDHVNFKIPAGSIMGLVGKNGAGKTTLIRLLTDVAHPTSGTYSIMGESDPKKVGPFAGQYRRDGRNSGSLSFDVRAR
jgi:ABC-2 type transport system ATP-binding protein